MRTMAVVLLVGAVAAGCASWPFGRGPALLEKADGLAREGKWAEAVRTYDEYLGEFPDASAAPRAVASRDTLTALLSARAEQARLRDEVTRQRDEVIRLQDDLARMQSDLARRETDLVRVRQEADRLRIDLEKLKQIDLRLERKR